LLCVFVWNNYVPRGLMKILCILTLNQLIERLSLSYVIAFGQLFAKRTVASDFAKTSYINNRMLLGEGKTMLVVCFIPWYDIGDIMTGAACWAGNTYPSGAPDFISLFNRGSCCPVIRVSLFHVIFLSFVFWVLIVHFVWLLGIYIFFTPLSDGFHMSNSKLQLQRLIIVEYISF